MLKKGTQQYPVIIGTRGSKLALWQANFTQNLLIKHSIYSEIKIIKTKGDATQAWNLSFDKLEGKGFFTKELEDALLNHEIDLAVHSCKDLPTQFPKGLTIAAYSKRANPFDILLIRKDITVIDKLLHLPNNAIVGTSSSRRKAQLLSYRDDIQVKDIRGNVPTRIEKLKNKEFDAIILASAGIERLAIDISEFELIPLTAPMFIPAAAQGVIAYQIREDNIELQAICSLLNDEHNYKLIQTERTLLNKFDGGCQIPLGIYLSQDENWYNLWISYASSWNAMPKRFHLRFNESKTVELDKIVEHIKQNNASSVFISRAIQQYDFLYRTLVAHNYSITGKSLLEFKPVIFALETLQEADWLFFSSKQAIKHFIEQLPELSILQTKKIAVLGNETANYLKTYQVYPDFIGDGFGKTTAQSFERLINRVTKVLFPSAQQSLYQVQKHITNKKVVSINLTTYNNCIKNDGIEEQNENILVFTSPLNVRAYFTRYSLATTQQVIAIGNTTAQELERFSIPHITCYQPYPYCIVDAIMSLGGSC